jgi:hypothetical protein
MRPKAARTGMLAIAAWAILTSSALAQDPGDASNKRTVEPPRTAGQAPREIQAPTGHRQPAARDVPSVGDNGDGATSHAANQEIDRRLNICRGC